MQKQRRLPILIGLCCCLLGGCYPQPKTPQRSDVPAASGSPAFHSSAQMPVGQGSFNLQKRHGLGGWDRPAGPSEQELLKKMSDRS